MRWRGCWRSDVVTGFEMSHSASNLPPIIIIGAGIAGLCTALAAAPRQVLLLSRGSAGSDGATPLAQGGIAAALGAGDNPAQHAHDTVIAGAGSNDREAVAVLTEQAPAAIAWLQQHGVAFDRDGDALSLHLEGGHRHARIAHAGGDRSGQRIANALAEAAKRAAHVRLQSGCNVDALLLRDGYVVGLRARDGNGQARQIMAAAVVLATGGIGALFACTSNPASADGAGLALGLRAGAAGRDLEFVQFHPTALAPNADPMPTQLPLISEAIRGAGSARRAANARPRRIAGWSGPAVPARAIVAAPRPGAQRQRPRQRAGGDRQHPGAQRQLAR